MGRTDGFCKLSLKRNKFKQSGKPYLQREYLRFTLLKNLFFNIGLYKDSEWLGLEKRTDTFSLSPSSTWLIAVYIFEAVDLIMTWGKGNMKNP